MRTYVHVFRMCTSGKKRTNGPLSNLQAGDQGCDKDLQVIACTWPKDFYGGIIIILFLLFLFLLLVGDGHHLLCYWVIVVHETCWRVSTLYQAILWTYKITVRRLYPETLVQKNYRYNLLGEKAERVLEWSSIKTIQPWHLLVSGLNSELVLLVKSKINTMKSDF